MTLGAPRGPIKGQTSGPPGAVAGGPHWACPGDCQGATTGQPNTGGPQVGPLLLLFFTVITIGLYISHISKHNQQQITQET